MRGLGPRVSSAIQRRVDRAIKTIRFRRQYDEFALQALADDRAFSVKWADRFPKLYDATSQTRFDAHYVYHPAWAARLVARTSPESHVDFSSLLQFAAILSAFVPVSFFDYRPATLKLGNLAGGAIDLTDLPFGDRSLKSVSCMHVVEHIGLGRYGDPLNARGDVLAMHELQRVIAPEGNLFFVVPVGRPRVAFNAHRIYSYDHIVEAFPELHLREFSLIPDDGEISGLITDASRHLANAQVYGCGCFWFQRPGAGEIRS